MEPAPFRAEGPGAKTRDGCAVELYLRLPPCGEVERIEPHMPGRDVLELPAQLDAVQLASALINTPSAAQRVRFLELCLRHLRPGGRLVFERFDPAWLGRAAVGPAGRIGAVELHLDRLVRQADHVAMSLRYRAGGDEWLQHFAAVPLDDGRICACLAQAAFGAPVWIDRRCGYAAR